MSIKIFNPATAELIREYGLDSDILVQEKIDSTYNAFLEWKHTDFTTRKKVILNIADDLSANIESYARIITEEMGKPFAQSIGEIEKCESVCRYYAENAEAFLSDLNIETQFTKSYAAYKPLGVVLAIMPWNFPFWQVFRFAVPAIIAGNAAVLKHSQNTMGSALAIESIFARSGTPDNLFTNLVIKSGIVSDVIANHRIAAITLTGSTPVGEKVAAQAGSHIKKTVMELGGSDPYIILADADIEKAVESCVTARMINSGQSCIAGKRFIVESAILDDVVSLFAEKMSKYKYGNPFDKNVNLGPMARKDLQVELHKQVRKSLSKGAELVLGGELPEHEKGYFYPATIVKNVTSGMPAYDDELFGPVASIIEARSEDEAIKIANDSIYGLGAAIFTSDIEKGEFIAANKIEAGACFVNDFVRSDARLPFGGIKQSGYGRELSEFGIKEFVNIKTIVVK